MIKRSTGFFVVLLMILCSSDLYADAKKMQVVVRSNNYPEIELVINVRDAASRRGIYGLRLEDFRMTEGGFKQESTDYMVKAEGKVDPIDIVFIFDETGSMQDEINAVRDNAINFAEILKGSGMDYRLALITFSDKVEKTFDFTSDANEFKKWVSSIKAAGGGDEPENDLEALNRAMKLPFRKNAQVVFILITDAPYHQNNSVTNLFMLPLAKKIKLENIIIYPIAIDFEPYHWMARETEGTYFNILQDFSVMIEQLASTLTAQYRIKYITSKSSFDNTMRAVEVSLTDGTSAKCAYKSAANVKVSSQLMEKNRPSDAYKPENMIDGKEATAWAEGSGGSGIGEWVEFGFDEPKILKSLSIIAGYKKTENVFYNNNRIKKIKLIFDDGKSQTAELADSMSPQRILIDRSSSTKKIRIEILEIYKGKKWNDTCISEIDFEYK